MPLNSFTEVLIPPGPPAAQTVPELGFSLFSLQTVSLDLVFFVFR